jgi:hypothetical protein
MQSAPNMKRILTFTGSVAEFRRWIKMLTKKV